MMKKVILFTASLSLAAGILSGCSNDEQAKIVPANSQTKKIENVAKVTFEVDKDISKQIKLVKKDITVDKEKDYVHPYIVTYTWEFPEGSILFESDPNVKVSYLPMDSEKWLYNVIPKASAVNDNSRIDATKKSGIVEVHFSSKEEMNDAIDKFTEMGYWKDAIGDRIAWLQERNKLNKDIEKFNVKNEDF